MRRAPLSTARRLRLTAGLAVGLTAGLAAGCGSATGTPEPASSPEPPAEPGPSPRGQLAARAAAAKDLVGVWEYALAAPGRKDRTITVVRAADGGWRVDVPGGALGGGANIAVATTGDGLFQCALVEDDPGCVRVDRLTPDIDPMVQRVFTDWLDVLTDRSAAVAISAAAPLEGVGGDCFAIEPSAASLVAPLDAGIYCYDQRGVLTGARLGFGSLTLTSFEEGALSTVDLPGPVVDAKPLPTAPPPSPSPEPSPEPSPSGRSETPSS